MSGLLYLVSTPIGNPEDMTVRAIRILKEVAIVAAEDTSHAHSLLLHYGIDTPLTSYHDLNKDEKTPLLIGRLHEGQCIALVSDAGTPLISDPGAFLVAQALASGIRVVPVPGPSAVLAALSASGLSSEAFVYQGYLPKKSTERRLVLEGTANIMKHPEFADMDTMRRLFETFEEKHHLVKLLDRCLDASGVRVVIGSETDDPALGSLALVASPYQVDQRSAGVVGLLGPTRMEYQRAVALVDYISRLLSSLLTGTPH